MVEIGVISMVKIAILASFYWENPARNPMPFITEVLFLSESQTKRKTKHRTPEKQVDLAITHTCP